MRIGLICLALAFVGCDDDGGGRGGGVQEVTVLFGSVTDASGAALAGVRVQGGGASTVTGADGTYQLDAPAISEVTIRFVREGYLAAVRTTPVLELRPTALSVQLTPEAPAQPIDAEMGGEVEGARGARVAVPAGAFVSGDGASIGGMVEVHLTPLDPGKPGEINGTAGRFQGRMGGSTVVIESFGMVEITVRQDGEALQVADGMALNIAIPAPEGMDAPPERAPLWSLDEATNEWVMEGEAVLDPDTGLYEAEIGHMSSWNVDKAVEATCITGTVETPDGDPLPGARITASGVDYFGTTTASSIEDGRFYVVVRKESTVTVTAAHRQGGGQQRTVMSGSAPTAVPPRPGIDECLEVGTWVVERGVVRIEEAGGDSREIDCRDVGPNPFAGTCAAGFFDVFTCWAPAGRCDLRGDFVNNDSFEIVYDNGSRATLTITDRDTGAFDATYYGPAGQVCATGERGADEIFWITVNGQRYGIPDREDEGDNDLEMICPDGERASFSQAEVDAIQACGVGGGGGDSSQRCTINGMEQPAPNPDPGPTPGAPEQGELNSQCGEVGPCNSGLQCCMIEGFPAGMGICLDPMTCQAAMNRGG